MKLSQEKQQWDHAHSDWEHWRSRVQDEMETAQVGLVLILSMYRKLYWVRMRVHIWLQAASSFIHHLSTGGVSLSMHFNMLRAGGNGVPSISAVDTCVLWCAGAVQADAAREARRGAAAQISELESRAAADKANLER
jgi:hypothetical protein